MDIFDETAQAEVRRLLATAVMATPVAILAGAVFLFDALIKGKVNNPRVVIAGILLSMSTGLMLYGFLIGLGVDARVAGGVSSMVGSAGEGGYSLVAKLIARWLGAGKEDR
jgi:hypothetical protein